MDYSDMRENDLSSVTHMTCLAGMRGKINQDLCV